jgi:hypothetical protein
MKSSLRGRTRRERLETEVILRIWSSTGAHSNTRSATFFRADTRTWVRVSAHPLSCPSDPPFSAFALFLRCCLRSAAELATASASFRLLGHPPSVADFVSQPVIGVAPPDHRDESDRSSGPEAIGFQDTPADYTTGSPVCTVDASSRDTTGSSDLLSPSGVVRITGWRLVRTHAADAACVLPRLEPRACSALRFSHAKPHEVCRRGLRRSSVSCAEGSLARIASRRDEGPALGIGTKDEIVAADQTADRIIDVHCYGPRGRVLAVD